MVIKWIGALDFNAKLKYVVVCIWLRFEREIFLLFLHYADVTQQVKDVKIPFDEAIALD